VAEHGCKWRSLPTQFGNGHTIHARMNRWSKNGVLDRVFEQLQRERILRVKVEAVGPGSPSAKVHPDGTGARQKTPQRPWASPEADGTPGFMGLPRMLERPLPSRDPRATRPMHHKAASSWTEYRNPATAQP